MGVLKSKRKTTYIFLSIVAVVGVVFATHSLSHHALLQLLLGDLTLRLYVHSHLALSLLVFSLVYILMATVSLPLESALCIVAGYYFGAVLGIVVSVLSATIGATAIFVLIKQYLHDWFHAHVHSPAIAKIAGGIRDDSFSYILFLRLVAVFPHFLVNTALALANVRTRDYVVATFLGIIPITTVFVLTGTQLETIRRTKTLLTPETVGVFLLLALVSLIPVFWKVLSPERADA